VLTDAKNNFMQETQGFIHAQPSMKIKNLRPVCVGVL
jgi:hypothetical protein